MQLQPHTSCWHASVDLVVPALLLAVQGDDGSGDGGGGGGGGAHLLKSNDFVYVMDIPLSQVNVDVLLLKPRLTTPSFSEDVNCPHQVVG